MVNLNDYLKLNSNAIVDLVNKKYVPAEMTKEPIFEELAGLLMGLFIHQHGPMPENEIRPTIFLQWS
jgi:hypothetical protein